MKGVTAFLGLGGNLGNRADNIRQGIALLAEHPEIVLKASSRLYETEPVGMLNPGPDAPPTPWFLNGAIRIETTLPPAALMAVCLDVERLLGRKRPIGNHKDQASGGALSRPLDIDILFFADRVICNERLTIPHPRLHQRAFVLAPLLELAPDWRHPVLGQTIQELHHYLFFSTSSQKPVESLRFPVSVLR